MSIQNELKANAQRLTSLLGIEAPLIGAPIVIYVIVSQRGMK